MSDETTAEMLAEIDRDLADIEKAVHALQEQAAAANYPQQVETTTDRLAEIEAQQQTINPDDVAAEALAGVFDETQGLQMQVRFFKDREAMLGTRLEEEKAVTAKRLQQVEELRSEVHYRQQLLTDERRRVEELAQKLAESQKLVVQQQNLIQNRLTTNDATEPQPEPQPVQVREGRWRTRGGEIRNVRLMPAEDLRAITYPWHDARYGQTWLLSGRYHTDLTESPLDLWEYLGSSEPEPQQIITPDDVAAEALARVFDQAQAERQIAELRSEVSYVQRLLGESRRRVTQLEELVTSLRTINEAQEKAFERATKGNDRLALQLEAVKAESAKRLETIQELRSEVSQVHRQWGDSRWRVEELEQKLAEPEPQPVHLQAMMEAQADTIARLNSEIHELHIDIAELETQLEAVKAELVQQAETSRRLQIELDAYELRSHGVSDRFEEGWDKGTAQAVETIAEWLEPLRQMIEKADNLVESDRASRLCAEIMQSLPAIMRSLTGLADED